MRRALHDHSVGVLDIHLLGSRRKPSLTETAKAWREYAPQFIPLPYPSSRNQPWFKCNPWFEGDVLPALQARINAVFAR